MNQPIILHIIPIAFPLEQLFLKTKSYSQINWNDYIIYVLMLKGQCFLFSFSFAWYNHCLIDQSNKWTDTKLVYSTIKHMAGVHMKYNGNRTS